MATSKRKTTTRRRSSARGTGRGSARQVPMSVRVEMTLLRIGGGGVRIGGRGGGGRGRAGGGTGGGRRSGGGLLGRLFGGLRTTAGELRAKPVQQRRVRRPVRRPNTIQEWERDRREQAELYEDLDTRGKVTTAEEDAELAEMHAQDVARGYRLRPSRTRIGHEVDPQWAPEGDDGSRRAEAIRLSRGGAS